MKISDKFIFRFTNTVSDEEQQISVEEIQSRYDAYQKARSELTSKLGISVREFENSWTLEEEEIALSITNTGDKQYKNLQSKIDNIDGVISSSFLDDPDNNEYVTFTLQTEPMANEDYVLDQIRQIFGNQINDGDHNVLIVINPRYV